jgi:hypothetical protein
LECAFDIVGKILTSRINGIYMARFWIQNMRDIDFKVISAAENSNKFPKEPGFGRKTQLRPW